MNLCRMRQWTCVLVMHMGHVVVDSCGSPSTCVWGGVCRAAVLRLLRNAECVSMQAGCSRKETSSRSAQSTSAAAVSARSPSLADLASVRPPVVLCGHAALESSA